ncbi:PLC-like phosphodiesterase [Lentinula edodes]|uniref:Phosphoinositide phospholipase C n=1 Tax=Lentinula lateritia TaxID=40482 RepID=A0A9W9E0Y3_9AGAR|nr:PLC-like phosphodiesterase [Lentinula edodes]
MDSQLHSQLNEHYRVDYQVNLHPPQDVSPRLSPAIEEYIQNTLETANELLSIPILSPSQGDDSYPLTHYFVSSSHNTYLLSRQLVGRASAESYTHALSRGAHCVEIDVWPSTSPEGLVVTHGYTFTKGVSFRKVCEAIGVGVDNLGPDAWPVLVSLECHVGPKGQQIMVDILKNAWGEKLVEGKLTDDSEQEVKVSPRELKGRIILMVEYYAPSNFAEVEAQEELEELDPDQEEESTTSDSIVEGEDLPQVLVGEIERGKISDELAALGYYARSWKPTKGWLQQELIDPRHILINISESKILSLLPTQLDPLIEHGRLHLRRIFPRGTRIRSSNMDILKLWRNGSHIVSLNWQTFDTPMQINEAMFVGSPGWVLKPKAQRLLNPDSRTFRFSAEIVGLTYLLVLPSKDYQDKTYKAYVEADLFHGVQDQNWKSKVVTTTEEGDAVWNEALEWEFNRDELAFLRLRVRENRSFEKDLDLAVFCARIDDLQQGWGLVHMFNMDGKASGATLLVKFEVTVHD